jgi:hypothetical protein
MRGACTAGRRRLPIPHYFANTSAGKMQGRGRTAANYRWTLRRLERLRRPAMEATKVEVQCPFMSLISRYFPIIPLVFPLVPMLLVIACLWSYLHRISTTVERIEELLAQIVNESRRIG